MSSQRKTIFNNPGIENLTDGLDGFGTVLTKFVGEFLGTAMILFFGCMGSTTITSAFPFKSEFSFGITVMAVIIVFGHISGGHFNPAVTLCAVLYGTLPLIMAPLYVLAQYIGAVAGFGLLKFLVADKYMKADMNGICATVLHEDVSPAQGLLFEFMATSALIFLVCGIWDDRNSKNVDSIPLKFGLFIILMSLTTGPYTGCGMNPARSFAPALLNNDWRDHWVYVAGPLLAGFVVTTFYIFCFGTRAPELERMKDDCRLDRIYDSGKKKGKNKGEKYTVSGQP